MKYTLITLVLDFINLVKFMKRFIIWNTHFTVMHVSFDSFAVITD